MAPPAFLLPRGPLPSPSNDPTIGMSPREINAYKKRGQYFMKTKRRKLLARKNAYYPSYRKNEMLVMGKQCPFGLSPLLLPSIFGEAIDLEEWERELDCNHKPELARSHVQKIKNGEASILRHRKFIFGALYGALYPGFETIDLSSKDWCDEKVVKIVVTLPDGTESVVKIGSAKKETGMLEGLRKLAMELPKRGNARREKGDRGEMFALGYRNVREALVFKPTEDPAIAEAMATASTAIGKYVEKHWTEDYKGVRRAEKAKVEREPAVKVPALEQMGGDAGLGNTMTISRNLGNSAHIDNRDQSRSIGVWVEEESPGNSGGASSS
jgi:hypothetical protein